MASVTSLLVIGIFYAAHLLGALSGAAVLASGAAIVMFIGGFYAMFRSGMNRRLADPSMTLAQMLAATLVVLGTMYAAQADRSIFLVLLLMVFMFGVLRFDSRALLGCAAFILLGYAAVIGLLWINKPGTVKLALEALQWLTLALALPWFAWMGGYIKELRTQLRRRNTELTEALHTARASEANLAEAQRIARIGMWIVDPVARRITWSPETYRLFELDPQKAVPTGREFLQLIHPDDQQGYNELIRPALLEGRSFDSEFRVLLQSGTVRWVHALGRPVVDEQGNTVVVRGTIRDITDQREADEHIRHLAHFDSLTGLPNRSLFTQLLARALAQCERRASPLAVLFIDLDGFKAINDELGHDSGDALLAAFASRLTASLRRSDAAGRMRGVDSAARLGGDEFVVLIDDFADQAQVEVVARRILSVTATPFQIGSERRLLGASIGIAVFPRDGDSLDSLMKKADSAMYLAKQAGKNTYRFYGMPDGASGQDPIATASP
jgi:diguanylate cyclase (GGDEF)-like protein/PAS domain S-box-containing protein